MNGGIERINNCFSALKSQNRAGLITFVTAGDPNLTTSLSICKTLVDSGADIIELGMPFTDPMADGPAIQKGNLRALKSGTTLAKTLKLLRSFREYDQKTPVILMGYYNPIFSYGVDRFLDEAYTSGCDGLIIVDLPPEEDGELCIPANNIGMSFIRLATPTTDSERISNVLENTSGFVYYVSMAGITGVGTPDNQKVKKSVEYIRSKTKLPIAVGFGIRTAEQARAIAEFADAAVVGSAFVDCIGSAVISGANIEEEVSILTKKLSSGINSAKNKVQEL